MSARSLWLIPLFFLCATAVVGLGPYRQLATKMKPPGTFDEAPAKSVEEVQARLAELGEEGVALYRRHFWTDLLFITLNLAAFWIALAAILPKADFPKSLLMLPIGTALADILENVAVRSLLSGEPSAAMVTTARYATYAKMAFFLAMVVVIVAGSMKWIWRRRSAN